MIFTIFFILFAFNYSAIGSGSNTDLSGVWTGTVTVSLMEMQETGGFVDVWYQDEDVLYMPGAPGCSPTFNYAKLYQVSNNTYSISSPINCSLLGIDIILNSVSLTFSNNSSFTATGSGSAENHPFNMNSSGYKMNPQILSNNVSISALSGAEDSLNTDFRRVLTVILG